MNNSSPLIQSFAQMPPVTRVYLVEDSSAIRDQIAGELSGICGIHIEAFAETERDALSSLMMTDYDVIIFDIQLSQGNGVNLLRTLAIEQKQTQALKIIFSNRTGESWRRRCASYGVRYFFDKSFEFPLLQATLLRVVSEAADR